MALRATGAVGDGDDPGAPTSAFDGLARSVTGHDRSQGWRIRFGDEGDRDALAADGGLQLVGGALGDDAAVVDDRDGVGEAVGLFQVLRREEHRRAAADEGLDDVPQGESTARVEARRGLVEEEHGRVDDEGAREVDAPPHAAREALDDAVLRLDEVEQLDELGRSPLRRFAPRW